jgi:hypothetical protein
MTQIDQNALDVAVESLRPLFREPVTYLEQAARDSIAAYLAALPPPAGDVGELVKRLRLQAAHGLLGIAEDHKVVSYGDAADALQSLSARLAEAERERDEARERASVYRTVLEAAGYQNIETIKDIMNAQELGAFVASMTIGIKSNLASATARAERLEAALREAREWLDKYRAAHREGEEAAVRGGLLTKLAAALSPAPAPLGDGWVLVINDIGAERRRQIEAEGWTPENDDTHDKGEMAMAGGMYALNSAMASKFVASGAIPRSMIDSSVSRCPPPPNWPWDAHWWKPKGRRRDLVKAAALIIAEIERLDRFEAARDSQERT